MPTIPTFQNLGGEPAPTPDTTVVPVHPGAPESALAGVGDAITQIGEHLNEARRASDLTNALGQAVQALGAKQLQYKRDPDFATIPDRFKSDASNIGESIGVGIRDPLTQRIFQQEYTKLAMSHQLAVVQDAANSEADFNKGQLKDNLETVAHAAAFANNDLARANNANVARVMIGEMENARWITHVEAQQFQQHFLQRVQETSIQRDLDADPVGTYKRLTTDPAYAPNVDPIVRSRYEHWAKNLAMPNEAKQDAQKAMTLPAAKAFEEAAPAGGEPFVQRVRLAESGGDPNAVSPAGAKGAMQVMDATNYNPGFGVMPARDESPAERERVGNDYAQAMLARYGGNETLAAAAYNAGPGKVDEWIAKYGDPRTGQISDAAFAQRIPFKETQGYVSQVASPATQAAGGVPQTPRDVRALTGTWVANAEAFAEQSHPKDAVYRDMVVNNVKSYVSTIAAAQEGQQRQFSSYLTGIVMDAANGGKNKLTSVDDLLSNPTARQAFVALDPYAQQGVIGHLDHNAREAALLETKSKPGLYADVVKRIYLPDGDPQKINSPLQLLQLVKGDGTGLSVADFERGKRELTDALTPEGAAFNRDKLRAGAFAERMMASGIAGRVLKEMQPEVFLDAVDRFRQDLDNAVAQARKDGKDPRQLLMHDSPDYFLKPSRVMSYLPNAQQAVATGAASVAKTASPQDRNGIVADARAAIAKGAPRAAVEARLKQFQIDPALLDQTTAASAQVEQPGRRF
jgi:hypothetical protein